jgi:drug/metabolite transporter (DMT)-like permease
MISTHRLREWSLLVLCNLIWGSQFAMVKLVQEEMGPIFATFFPMLLATFLLIPIVYFEKASQTRGNPARLAKRDFIDFLVMGILGQVGAQLFVTWGVRLSTASNAALVQLTLPVCTALVAYLIVGERMSPVRWISFALAIAGVLQCSGIDFKQLNFRSREQLLGGLMIFIAVNGSAFYNVYGKKLLHRFTPLEVLLFSNYMFVISMIPVTLYAEPDGFMKLGSFSPKVWVGLAILTLFQYLLSMVIFLNVLTRIEATQAALANYMIPFFGVVIAAIVLHERLTTTMIAGGVLVLASTLLITIHEESQRSSSAAKAAD